ncbi:MAG TPA: amylo-alpha-1,6-glucosidase [Acidobacteriota bacterium]|nr:amylo-alpha-1,6-glucosidase [Acidobacteriota bacterium]
MINPEKYEAEWLETDGLGGFASGTVSGIRTRRYHALLLTATNPPSGRLVLVNGFEAWVEDSGTSYPITSQRYGPDVIHPNGIRRLEDFHSDPWPRWSYLLEDGCRIQQEIFVRDQSPIVVINWRLIGNGKGVNLHVRPLLSGRDYHSLHHENPNFHFEPQIEGQHVIWTPYEGIPQIVGYHNGMYSHDPIWYLNFVYTEEQLRGLDFTEDLASPGSFVFHIGENPAVLVFSTEADLDHAGVIESFVDQVRKDELKRRSKFAGRIQRSADQYIVKRKDGKTIIAGYPWFTDWGRDTFISLRGLAIASPNLKVAGQILNEWSHTISEGMLPNRFPDHGETPEFNSVDASLWFVIAVHDYLKAAAAQKFKITPAEKSNLQTACDAILTGYRNGTRYHIHMDDDCLIAAGVPGVQLTWMDAKVGDWVITPRIGKPVEIQALWLNALRIASEWNAEWLSIFQQGCENFRKKFWNADGGYLHDVVDADHISGKNDSTFRPNQIFAVGGLPFQILVGNEAIRVVDAVEARLLTPTGLRSLAPGEAGYTSRYEGGVLQRDSAYHQGIVWPWLLGAFVEAWVRVRNNSKDAKVEAVDRFVSPLLHHMDRAGIGHISEITDADAPFKPRGCPFQAWSLAEVLRLLRVVLAEDRAPKNDVARKKVSA